MHKILIAEDEVDVLDTLKVLIEAKLKSCHLVTASNGLDAFIEAQKQKFDLIITDNRMPFMTGAAFVIGVRTKETPNSDTPIIMLSAFIDNELKDKLRLRNVEFIEKPFTPDDFVDAIRKYLL